MGDATRTYFLEVLANAIEIIEGLPIDYVTIGSIAHSCHFGDDWDPGADIDLLMTRADAERCLEIFRIHGYATHVRDPEWIFKVAKPNVTFDLIFVAGFRVEMDAQLLDHSVSGKFEGLKLKVASVEDMALISICSDDDSKRGHWYEAMRYLRAVRDWDYFVDRSGRLARQKTLSALLYAQEIGIDIPDGAIEQLSVKR